MKKSVLVGFLLVAVVLAYFFAMKKTEGETRAAAIFGPGDLVVNDVRFGESPEDVEKKLGRPESTGQDEMVPATGEEYYKTTYEGLELWFFRAEGDTFSLRQAVLSGPGYVGPRGLRVGDSKERVVAAFPSPRDHGSSAPNVDLLYASGASGERALPPMGSIERDEDSGNEIVSYVCPTPSYEEQIAAMGALDIDLDYVYLEHAAAWFEIVDGKVSQIHLSQGALAE